MTSVVLSASLGDHAMTAVRHHMCVPYASVSAEIPYSAVDPVCMPLPRSMAPEAGDVRSAGGDVHPSATPISAVSSGARG